MAADYLRFLSIRGIFFILLGMAGSVIGDHLIKAGVQTPATFFHTLVLNMACFFLILLGIAVWGYDIISADKGRPETGSPDDDPDNRQKMSPRDMQSLMLAGAGMLLIMGAINFLGVWKIGSQDIWLLTGVYCSVAIVGFSLLYILGYYVLFRAP